MKTQEELRSQMREQLLDQKREVRSERSWKIAEKVLHLPQFQKANVVHFYVSLPSEVDTEMLIDRALGLGKRIILPCSDFQNKILHWYEIKSRAHDLKRASSGIFEPNKELARKFNENVECVFVPGIVFDKNNNRVGRGAGFYDRFLSKLRPDARKVGLAFSFQVVPEIPVNSHDIKMDEVITD